jgi:hypothetical protein
LWSARSRSSATARTSLEKLAVHDRVAVARTRIDILHAIDLRWAQTLETRPMMARLSLIRRRLMIVWAAYLARRAGNITVATTGPTPRRSPGLSAPLDTATSTRTPPPGGTVASMRRDGAPAVWHRVEQRRRAVALAYHYREAEGLSIAQIAHRLGRAPATIKAYFYDPSYANKETYG